MFIIVNSGNLEMIMAIKLWNVDFNGVNDEYPWLWSYDDVPFWWMSENKSEKIKSYNIQILIFIILLWNTPSRNLMNCDAYFYATTMALFIYLIQVFNAFSVLMFSYVVCSVDTFCNFSLYLHIRSN